MSYCIPSYPIDIEHSAYDFNYPAEKMRRLQTKAQEVHNFFPFIKENVYFVKRNGESYINFRNKVRNFEFPDCTLCDGSDDRLGNKKASMFN
ncbi:MAG: hypothetical protein SOZ34_03995 [Clostridia bacterium]|nr:hypothetical protein [Clostridia bacterium]